jgi:hypothetical protein
MLEKVREDDGVNDDGHRMPEGGIAPRQSAHPPGEREKLKTSRCDEMGMRRINSNL